MRKISSIFLLTILTSVGPVACSQKGGSLSGMPVSSSYDDSAVRLFVQAQQAFRTGDYAKAIELAEQTADASRDNGGLQQAAAELLYLSGAAEKSLAPFDRAVKLMPEKAPQNWQRGIALATCGKFEAGAAQFKTHHDVNPDDVENSAWYFLCVAKTDGIDAARKTVIPSRSDPREPMMSVLAMLKNSLEPKMVLQAAIEKTEEGPRRQLAQFYAALYVGLYYDSLGNKEEAIKHLKLSLSYDTDGYMTDTARVYLQTRFLEQAVSPEPSKE